MKLVAFIVFALHSSLKSIFMNAMPMQSINMLFVKDYLKFNNIPICVFLGCDNITERLKTRIDFQHDDVWINWWGVSKASELRSLNYTNILVRLTSPMSVVINLECNNADEVLEEISSRKMFHYERFWLIFGKDLDQAYARLTHQFVNMDAEILLALPDNEK